MSQEGLPERVRASLLPIEKLKGQVRGDADLELVIQRVEQIELLLEGMAELRTATNDTERAAAEKKVAVHRLVLSEPLWRRC